MSDRAVDIAVPPEIAWFVSVSADPLGGTAPAVTWTHVDDGLYRVTLAYDLAGVVQQDDWRLDVTARFAPDFHWSPHLTPTAEHVIDQHVFRSPALVLSSELATVILVPDLDLIGRGSVRWYLDLDAPANRMTLGMSETEIDGHVLYRRKPGAVHREGRTEVGFYLFVAEDEATRKDPWRPVLELLWRKWGHARFAAGEPLPPDLTPYVEHTYAWAFDRWAGPVWQELDLAGKRVGAPTFIVSATQSPGNTGPAAELEMRSIWNQAWFSSLRSASGVWRWAERTKNEELRRRALMTKELALSAPVRDGFFPAVLATEMETATDRGAQVRRSKGWQTAYWGSSDRNPVNRPPGKPRIDDLRKAPYHVLDMSWTALWMLRWNDEIEKDPRLVAFAKSWGDRLLRLQDPRGFFPAWIDVDTLQPLDTLSRSPESALSATFLFALERATGDVRFRQAALGAVNAIVDHILPTGRWEDFETYWSCSSWGSGDLVGRKVTRNDQHKQNNFSMFWTAEALREATLATEDHRWIEIGRRVIDELLMTQASWQPPYMFVNVVGGFGVLNADAEWNDARGSLFAELLVDYGFDLGVDEYVERGLAALRSSFVMMYCPENPGLAKLYEKRFPWFGPADHGFMMENYGHDGRTSPDGVGIGDFTIYDWGNGAASEAFLRMVAHLGPDVVLGK
jgi:hypothetical protein